MSLKGKIKAQAKILAFEKFCSSSAQMFFTIWP